MFGESLERACGFCFSASLLSCLSLMGYSEPNPVIRSDRVLKDKTLDRERGVSVNCILSHCSLNSLQR